MLVREGETVAAGQVLARQEDALLSLNLERAARERDRLAARLAELERGPRPEDVTQGRARLAGAEARRTGDEAEYRRLAELVQRELASGSELDAARARWQSSVADVAEARAALQALVEGTTAEELAQARTALAGADAEVELRQVQLARLTLRAPRDGLVDTIPVEAGDRPAPGEVVLVLLADGLPYARAYVPQSIRAHVLPGTEASVRVDGWPGSLRARVRSVAAEPVFTPYFALTERDRSRLAYVAEIELLDADAGSLPVGLPLEVDLPGLAIDSVDAG
jgi:HlyD family secretion protein